MLLNFTHDVTGYNPMIHFHDVKALNYEMGTVKQKHMPYSVCSAMQQWNDAVYPPIYIFLKCMSPWKLTSQAVSKCLHPVNQLSKQEFINVWHLPYFTSFMWIADAWWPLIIWGVAWNFSSGLIVSVCCCEFWYCNQHPLGCFTHTENHSIFQPKPCVAFCFNTDTLACATFQNISTKRENKSKYKWEKWEIFKTTLLSK